MIVFDVMNDCILDCINDCIGCIGFKERYIIVFIRCNKMILNLNERFKIVF